MYIGYKWTTSTMSVEINNDVNVTSITNKNILRWNSTFWVNVADLTNDEANIATLQVSTKIIILQQIHHKIQQLLLLLVIHVQVIQ